MKRSLDIMNDLQCNITSAVTVGCDNDIRCHHFKYKILDQQSLKHQISFYRKSPMHNDSKIRCYSLPYGSKVQILKMHIKGQILVLLVQMVVLLLGQLAGSLVGLIIGCLVGQWLVDFVCSSIRWLIGWLVRWTVGWLVC